ncbi:MAG: PQQ-dependent sugar dehydrogenase, partial [Bacteroidota bacterium]
MKTRWTWWVAICLIGCTSLLNLCAVPAEQGEEDNPLQHITLPEGFRIDYFAQNVTNARSMARGDNGTLFVGTRREGKVYAIVDRDNDFKADQVYTLASGLNMPNGVAFRNGSLYVAEVNRVMRFDAIESQLENPPEPVVVNDQFPSDRHHGWKYIAFGPDDKLYVPVGAPCNICEKDEEIYSSITRMDPDGSNLEVYAHGVRNSVGFTWHPTTGHLWFTDNGRDMLGDDLPADELNNAPSAGMHFGYPYCHQGDTPDPEFGAKRNCDEFTPPAL